MEARLIRFVKTQTHITKGIWLFDGKPVCCTLELPWRDNRKRVSCIPPGNYRCERCKLKRYRITGTQILNAWEIMDVPDRTGILIHTGNWESDTEGCIIIGTMFNGESITQSKVAHKRWLECVKAVDEFQLTVEYVEGL